MQDGELLLAPDSYGIIVPNRKDTLGTKLLYFESVVKHLIATHKPNHIIIEDIFCGFNKVSFKCLAEYRGVAIKAIYESTGCDPYSMMAVEARKAVGVGCKKEQAWAGAVELFGLGKDWDFIQHNDIMDSFVLCYALYLTLTGEKPRYTTPAIKVAKPRKRKRRTKRKVK